MQDLSPSQLTGLFVLCLFAALTALLIVGWGTRKARQERDLSPATPYNNALFLFSGEKLVEATPAALAFADVSAGQVDAWQALYRKFCDIAPALGLGLRELTTLDRHFQKTVCVDGENLLISGHPDGKLTRIFIAPTNAEPDALTDSDPVDDKDDSELSILRDVVELSPAIAWKKTENGDIVWATQSYQDLLSSTDIGNLPTKAPLPELFENTDPVRPNATVRRSLRRPGAATASWFEETASQTLDGGQVHYAIHADPVVRAEESLRNFVQTLTQTFAHLPVGLAIFDRNRQLALFNPALLDLTELDPQWLSARPTLYDFLDRMRENRHIPEPKDYKGWRDQIAALEREAEDGTYEEHWPLPNGRTYKVIGRPHPQGAVAFLFEDITDALSLQRQFRSELDLSQSVIDALPMALAVFSASGDLVMSNTAFSTLWGIDPGTMLARLTFPEAIDLWQSQCAPGPNWQDLHQSTAYNRTRRVDLGWIQHSSQRTYHLELDALARGAVMCIFTPLARTHVATDADLVIRA